jgi:sRNA-binding protein
MNRASRKVVSEKPVVVVRRKVGKGNGPAGPPQPRPHPSPPVQKAEAPVEPPQPPQPAQPVPSQPPAPPAVTEPGPSKTAQEKQARWELLEILRDRWPQAFPLDSQRVRPLAVGIRQDIAAHLPQQPLGRIGAAIGLFQRLMGPAYFRAVLRGGSRYDLDGNPRGEVTPAEQGLAKRDLQAFYERRKKKAAASASAPHEDSSPGGLQESRSGDTDDAKGQLEHGEFGEMVERELPFS